jgi:hypothetical protein
MPLRGSAAERAEHVATRTAAKWRAFGRERLYLVGWNTRHFNFTKKLGFPSYSFSFDARASRSAALDSKEISLSNCIVYAS